jgi:alpha-D-ribose 1-methylphosphonate 5-triphosphate synthase subunit PhnG
LIRAALLKIVKTCLIGALSIGVLATFLLSYSYVSGDRQDRAEMVAVVDRLTNTFTSKPRGFTNAASLSSEN